MSHVITLTLWTTTDVYQERPWYYQLWSPFINCVVTHIRTDLSDIPIKSTSTYQGSFRSWGDLSSIRLGNVPQLRQLPVNWNTVFCSYTSLLSVYYIPILLMKVWPWNLPMLKLIVPHQTPKTDLIINLNQFVVDSLVSFWQPKGKLMQPSLSLIIKW